MSESKANGNGDGGFEAATVERYRKVARLASGSGPEADVAKAKAAKMLAEHPGLDAAARRADQREAAEEAMRHAGYDGAAFDDRSWYAGLAELQGHLDGTLPEEGVERAWWGAVRWAADRLRQDTVPDPPENARKREPPPKGKRQTERTIARRIREEVEVEEGYEGRDADTNEPLITVAFTLPCDLWDHIVGAKVASMQLVKHLDGYVEEYDPDAEDDEDDDPDDPDGDEDDPDGEDAEDEDGDD